ncbi:MAG: hypothetical protein ACF8R7_02435 [Phycisphaerales bacterium JB039]
MRTNTVRPAFTLPDAIWGSATLAAAAILLLAAAGHVRQQHLTASSLSQLRWIAGATGSYAADNADRYWAFSWEPGHTGSQYPDLRGPTTYAIAGMYQAIDILRRRGIPDMPKVPGLIPHILYSHLPLIDYLDRDMPDFNFIAPGDKYRLLWARDPEAFAEGAFLPFQPEPELAKQRWVYSSSYDLPPAFFDQSPFGSKLSYMDSHIYFIYSTSIIAAYRISDVAYPAAKIHVFDRQQRELGGGGQFALFENSQTPALIADGSVRIVRTADTNPGGRPNTPTLAVPTYFQHHPYAWEPGESAERVIAHYRATRGGVAGRDFGGPEIDTGQP